MNVKQALAATLAYAVVGSSAILLSATELAVADSAQVAGEELSPPSSAIAGSCPAASRPEARALADRFYQQRAFSRAGECYRVAAEYSLADRAFLRAAEPESAATARALATNRDEVKTQVHKLQQAFRGLRRVE
jgi:uncharacterized protein (DUF2342 family)